MTIASKFGVVGHEKETKAVNNLQKTVSSILFNFLCLKLSQNFEVVVPGN